MWTLGVIFGGGLRNSYEELIIVAKLFFLSFVFGYVHP
jgi:hypothetical protein